MNYIDQLAINLGLSNGVLLLAVTLVSLTAAILLAVSIWQWRRISQLTRPKYGFLGKPLLSAILVLVLVGGITLVYSGGVARPDYSVEDELSGLELAVFVEVESPAAADTWSVFFEAQPEVNGRIWAIGDELADTFWTITGAANYSEVRSGLSSANRGGFMLELPRGDYQLELVLSIRDEEWVTRYEFSVP